MEGEAFLCNSNFVLTRGTEPIIRFRLCFILILGLVLAESVIGMGMGCRFFFWVFKYGS